LALHLLRHSLGLKGEAAIDYANGFATSEFENRPDKKRPCTGSQMICRRNGILEQQVAKRMNGFLHTAPEQIESGK
jgi:hypothetical protein